MDRLGLNFEFKVAKEGPEGSFTGYGAFFGNVDAYGDVIKRGAFKDTLKEWDKNGFYPPMLLNHGSGGWGGSPEDDLPIGAWTEMQEDEKGLVVSGVLATKTRRGAEVYELMRMDPKPAINGLSIGFRVKEAEMGTKPTEPRRTIKKVDLFEISVVTMPANGKARVSSVKSAESIKTIRDFEAFLRDAGRFSHAAAKAIASRGFKAAEPRDEDEAQTVIADALRRSIAALQR